MMIACAADMIVPLTSRATSNRRHILQRGLAAAGVLAIPGLATRALAKGFATPGVGANGATPAATTAPAAIPATASALTTYQRKVVAVAMREHQRVTAHLWRHDLVAIADFAQPSALPRLHFIDMAAGTLRSRLVAHGIGSDPEGDGWLKNFSNVINSRATSRGAYLTGSWYTGKYGTSIRLIGIDDDNSHALERAIVMHPAWYAGTDMLAKWGKLGRSDGCFAMAPNQFDEALWALAGGRLLFADRIGET